MSLILSNVPKSPKFINGSFAAMFDNNQVSVHYIYELVSYRDQTRFYSYQDFMHYCLPGPKLPGEG